MELCTVLWRVFSDIYGMIRRVLLRVFSYILWDGARSYGEYFLIFHGKDTLCLMASIY